MTASYHQYILNFKKPSGTSRGVLTTKETWIVLLKSDTRIGIGECGLLRGLSIDDRPDYEAMLKWVCENSHLGLDKLLQETVAFPSIQFGLETAFQSLKSESPYLLFPSDFTEGSKFIPINGLIWMGTKEDMKRQVREKIESGFSCIKMKIGAIDFDSEVEVLKSIREEFSEGDIEIRVDANGAFKPQNALELLHRLSSLKIHSIEQPIKQGQFQEMAELCEKTPIPIALDEELIGVFDVTDKASLLQMIRPHYIILKPSFIGGFKGSMEWIELANNQNIDWWVTSALESNIGLNAIAQWTYQLKNSLPQGLGTGSLFTNNFDSPLQVKNGTLRYEPNLNWNINLNTL